MIFLIPNTPIRTPNLYGYRLCGNIPRHKGTYPHMNAYFPTVTSSAFADDMRVSPDTLTCS